ncbi:hypothetical protein BCR44DRAFT_37054, partial [Catenaria anguillulae PL171]
PMTTHDTDLPSGPLPNCLLLGTTTHARVHPRRRAFTYPVLYLGVDLADLEAGTVERQSLGVIAHNKLRPLAVWNKDYLTAGHQSIRAKLLAIVKDQSAGSIQPAHVGRVFMVTMPRYLNYAFNPLTTYYCYSATNPAQLACIVLEVNNTFGERHVYLCNPAHNATPLPAKNSRAYSHAFTVGRAFHVSPFNTRAGVYHVLTLSPDAARRLDIKLTMEIPDPPSITDPLAPSMQKVLTADLRARQLVPLTLGPLTLLRTLFGDYPTTILLTLPRVLYQAYGLAFTQKLWVYARPPIYTRDAPQLALGQARTIRALHGSALARQTRALLATGPGAAWPHAAKTLGIPLVLRDADPLAPPIMLGTGSLAQGVQVHVLEADAWEWLALCPDPVQGLIHAYVKGDIHVHPAHLVPVLRVLVHAARSPSPRAFRTGAPVRWVRRLGQVLKFGVRLGVPNVLGGAAGSKHRMWMMLAPVEAHGRAVRSRRAGVYLALLLLYTLVVQILARTWFAGMAKFAWSPLEFEERIRRYAEGRGKVESVPADRDVDGVGDEGAKEYGKRMATEEWARWVEVTKAMEEVL